MKSKLQIYDIVLISLLTSFLFVQEQLLTFIPNVQLTIFIIVLYSKKLGLIKTSLIVTIHVLLDSFYTSSFGIIYTPYIFIGLMLIPLTLTTIFKKINNHILLGLLGIVYSIIYSWLFLIPFVFILEVNPYLYIASDIPFQILLSASSFLSIIVLYEPTSNLFDHLLKKN